MAPAAGRRVRRLRAERAHDAAARDRQRRDADGRQRDDRPRQRGARPRADRGQADRRAVRPRAARAGARARQRRRRRAARARARAPRRQRRWQAVRAARRAALRRRAPARRSRPRSRRRRARDRRRRPRRAPLRVLRASPDGEVPVAPPFAITFSEPMVAVTSASDAAATVPVQLSPQPPGHWRWLGTRTIVFQPDVRLPQATDVPRRPCRRGRAPRRGRRSPPRSPFDVRDAAADGRVVVAGRQQRPAAARRAGVRRVRSTHRPVRGRAARARRRRRRADRRCELLDVSEIGQDAALAREVAAAHANEQDGRWLASRPVHALPIGAHVQIVVDAGTPSAEGPRTTTAPQSAGFETYAALRVDHAQCGGGGSDCHAGNAIAITTNNPLDEQAFDPSAIAIAPPLADAKIVAQDRAIYIYGDTAARTRYRITLPARLADAFGQTSAPTPRSRSTSATPCRRSSGRARRSCSIPPPRLRRSTCSRRTTRS